MKRVVLFLVWWEYESDTVYFYSSVFCDMVDLRMCLV